MMEFTAELIAGFLGGDIVGDKQAVGQFRDVRITGANKWSLFGELSPLS